MTSKKSQRVVPWNKATIQGEARHIVSRATDHAVTIVTLGPLVFFATATGDSWMLDSQEALALCLARAGCEQDYRISENPGPVQRGLAGALFARRRGHDRA